MPAFWCGGAGAAMSVSNSTGWEALQVLPGDNRIYLLGKKCHGELPQFLEGD